MHSHANASPINLEQLFKTAIWGNTEKSYFFTSLRHALSDLGIDFDILRDKHNLKPNFLPYPIILRFLDLLKRTKL